MTLIDCAALLCRKGARQPKKEPRQFVLRMYEDTNGTKTRPPILREVEYGSGKQSFCSGTLRATLNLC